MEQCVAIDIEAECRMPGEGTAWSGAHRPFEEIVRQHSRMVYSIAFNFFRDVGAAEDICQEAFLKLSLNLGSIQSETHLALWLRRAAVRLCIDEHRKFAKRFVALDVAMEPTSGPDGEDFLAIERIREMVSRLPKQSRMALILRYQEDLSPSEIAEIMQESLNTTKSRIKRAIGTLRGKLTPVFGFRPEAKDKP